MKQLTSNEYVWLLAEWDLMLHSAFLFPRSQNPSIYLPESVEIYPERIFKHPQMEDVRDLVHKIDKKDFSLNSNVGLEKSELITFPHQQFSSKF